MSRDYCWVDLSFNGSVRAPLAGKVCKHTPQGCGDTQEVTSSVTLPWGSSGCSDGLPQRCPRKDVTALQNTAGKTARLQIPPGSWPSMAGASCRDALSSHAGRLQHRTANDERTLREPCKAQAALSPLHRKGCPGVASAGGDEKKIHPKAVG